jgi:hypothetical protein
VAQEVRRITVADDTERRAWRVLQTANRTQAKGSTVRLVFPSAPEMSYELEPPLTETELSAVEEYLLGHGYVAPANIGLKRGTFMSTSSTELPLIGPARSSWKIPSRHSGE